MQGCNAPSQKAHFLQVCLFCFKYWMHNYFYHLTNLPPLPRIYNKMATQVNYQWPEEHKLPSQITLGRCPDFLKSAFIKELQTVFPGTTAAFFRNEPSSFYDWHCDLGGGQLGPRTCCINYPLSDNPGAVTMFKNHSYNRMNHAVTICDYTVNCGTLFNTQHPHAVLNPSDTPRYIMSVSFFGVPFETVKEYLLSVNIKGYH